MLRIGLTGGIGSGKTTIANIFSTLGIAIYNADAAAKNIMNTDENIRQQLTEEFGSNTYQNGQLDRSYLSSKVFNNPTLLAKLNTIVHPATVKDSIDWFAKQQEPYAIKEAALIFESGSESHLDYVIGVWAEKELRIERVSNRDAFNRADIISRMDRQMDEDKKMKRCHFVIDNNEKISVIQQVVAIHQKLQSLAKNKVV